MFFFDIPLEKSDQEFMESIYMKYRPLCIKTAMMILKDPEASDAAVTDTFIHFFPKISLMRTLSCNKLVSYVVISVKNQCLNQLKKASRKHELLGEEDDFSDFVPDTDTCFSPEECYNIKELSQEISHYLHKLSSVEQDLLYYKYSINLSDEKIGEIMKIPPKNVRVYVYRAKQKLKKMLQEGGVLNV